MYENTCNNPVPHQPTTRDDATVSPPAVYMW